VRVDRVVALGVDEVKFRPQWPPPAKIRTSSAWAAWPTKGMHVLAAALRGAPYGAECLTGISRDKVAELLRETGIYVFPSIYEETWGLCLTEAMASGCACVVSDVAGAVCQVDDGRTGLVYPRNDAAALRGELDRLMSDDALRWKLGEAARAEVVRTRRTVEGMTTRWTLAYKEAMTAGLGRR
jgi:glycosyltransferase involved in cell wall biosynthesis